MTEQTRHSLAGVPIIGTTPERAVEYVLGRAAQSADFGEAIHLVNAYTIALALRRPGYGSIIESSHNNFPDGRPLSLVLRVLNKSACQIRGPQLFREVINQGQNRGVRHFFLGSTPETLRRLQNEIQLRYPRAEICGAYSPPFGPMSDTDLRRQDETIRRAAPDIVWVGLGTPKQDLEVERLAAVMPGVHIAVGAAFDFTAKTIPEAPRWITALCLEWLARFLSEPRRLWKRYLLGNALFMVGLMSPRFARAVARKTP